MYLPFCALILASPWPLVRAVLCCVRVCACVCARVCAYVCARVFVRACGGGEGHVLCEYQLLCAVYERFSYAQQTDTNHVKKRNVCFLF